MEKDILLVVAILVCVFTGTTNPMESWITNKKEQACIAMITPIVLLKEEAGLGSKNHLLALYDFEQKVKNPEYVIYLKSSQQILRNRGILDEKGDIVPEIRAMFEGYK